MIKTAAYLERETHAYHDLAKFVAMIARNAANPNHWALNEEDLTAEMYLVLAKLLPRYLEKPYEEFLLITRTSMANAVKGLVYKYTLSHRRSELTAYSLNWPSSISLQVDMETGDVLGDSVGPGQVRVVFGSSGIWLSPETYVEQAEVLESKIRQLCEFDQEVLKAVLGYNERVAMYIELQRKRKNFVYLDPTISISSQVVARALCVTIGEVEQAYERIKGVL